MKVTHVSRRHSNFAFDPISAVANLGTAAISNSSGGCNLFDKKCKQYRADELEFQREAAQLEMQKSLLMQDQASKKNKTILIVSIATVALAFVIVLIVVLRR